MAEKVAQVLKNETQYSKSDYKIMKLRSDGHVPDQAKPATPADDKIHLGHIVDSSQYNLRHDHDHTAELVFDYGRLAKEDQKYAARLQRQTKSVLNPVFKKMELKLTDLRRQNG